MFSSGRSPCCFNPELWVMNADGSGERRVQAAASADGTTIWSDARPVWSPDGRWIAYESNVGEDIYIVRPDGSQKTNLTSDHRSREHKPTRQPRCRLRGGGGSDGGPGRDRLFGGAGDDVLLARDGRFDVAGCGPGRDTVVADRGDLVGLDCELVRRA